MKEGKSPYSHSKCGVTFNPLFMHYIFGVSDVTCDWERIMSSLAFVIDVGQAKKSINVAVATQKATFLSRALYGPRFYLLL